MGKSAPRRAAGGVLLACAWALGLAMPLLSGCGAPPDERVVTAVAQEDERQIERLLARDGNPNATDAAGTPVLHLAIQNGNLDMARRLLEAGADPNRLAADGVSALRLGVMLDRQQMVELLLAQGANPNQRDEGTTSALGWAVSLGQVGMVERLLEAGARLETRPGGMSPVHQAIIAGNLDMLRLLISAGADLNGLADQQGNTPLMLAALQGRREALALLLEAGADPRWQNLDGKTAIDYAREMGHADVANLLQPGAAPGAAPSPPGDGQGTDTAPGPGGV